MAETTPDTPGPKEPSPFDRLVERLHLSALAGARFSSFALLAAVSIACAFVISPALSSQQIPELGAADLGRPFQGPSAAGFKAARDHEIVDAASTDLRRQEARSSVKPVYDYKPGAVSELKRAVRDAFDPMQEIAAAVPTTPPAPEPKRKKGSEPPAPDRAVAPRSAARRAARLRAGAVRL